eukprot:TRINITY_DN2875_c0_g1_i1.p1 TRINITY_DN2875_c0_g1~~TRINITY_DN2875_c0_g1_i1.p1  ORF type:complete len:173 (+),score=45.52 TRINITY_DN2875_c0_g1_i1:24-521(+)
MTTTIKRKWAFDFNQEYSKSSTASAKRTNVTKSEAPDLSGLKMKKAWDMATAPGKGIFMQGFMLWMAGSGVNIFTIMMVGYAMINPLKAIFSTNTAFKQFEDAKRSLFTVKAIFVMMNLLTLGVAVYKCATLGFLPTTPSDWISFLPVKQPKEFSGGGSVFPFAV